MSEEKTGIDATLAERGNRYGEFEDHALITQLLKATMVGDSDFIEELLKQDRIIDKCLEIAAKWRRLSPAHKEALEMIAHKIGRILNGDPNYADSWHDIAGYAKLGEDTCIPAFEFKHSKTIATAFKDASISEEETPKCEYVQGYADNPIFYKMPLGTVLKITYKEPNSNKALSIYSKVEQKDAHEPATFVDIDNATRNISHIISWREVR